MKVLITGSGGQLGCELQLTAPPQFDVVAYDHSQLDITDADSVLDTVIELAPDLIINSAAYTAVDRAEEDRATAFLVNASGAALIARASARIGARLIHLSTDFVFSDHHRQPIAPDQAPKPINVYGESKLEGEREVAAILGEAMVIVRTAWVYSRFGRNFVKTMVALLASRDQVRVIDDQIGSPTWARGLAGAVWRIAETPVVSGILHWTDDGETTWFGFAQEIQKQAKQIGLLSSNCEIQPISTIEYPMPARRPSYSVLDRSHTQEVLQLASPQWEENLKAMLLDWQNHDDA